MIFWEFIRWTFDSFWRFLGLIILLIVVIDFAAIFFDFIVELIHGKPKNIFYDNNLDRKENGEEKRK